MITFRKEKNRNWWGMSQDDQATFSELIWLLKHTCPPIGFNRKPLTKKQEKMIEDFFDMIAYPDNFTEYMNQRHGQ